MRFLCKLGVHHVPEERRHWYSGGWQGNCTRCGEHVTGRWH